MQSRFSPLTGIAVLLFAVAGMAPPVAHAQELRFGVAAFGNVDPLAAVGTMKACGCDYIEPALSRTLALAPDALAEAERRVKAAGLRIETMNWFLPGSEIPLTGPNVDRDRIRDYLERSLALASRLGAKVIVFGSPGARTVPDGFPREKAWAQLKDFLRLAGGIIQAQRYDLVIGIEPLRKPETNIINSVAEAIRLAREVDHPNIRIIVDFYHLAFENEDPDVILGAGDLIAHLQIADPRDREFPKDAAHEPRYGRFFENLRRIGYRGRLSIEANAANLEADCPASLAFLRRMAAPGSAAR